MGMRENITAVILVSILGIVLSGCYNSEKTQPSTYVQETEVIEAINLLPPTEEQIVNDDEPNSNMFLIETEGEPKEHKPDTEAQESQPTETIETVPPIMEYPEFALSDNETPPLPMP